METLVIHENAKNRINILGISQKLFLVHRGIRVDLSDEQKIDIKSHRIPCTRIETPFAICIIKCHNFLRHLTRQKKRLHNFSVFICLFYSQRAIERGIQPINNAERRATNKIKWIMTSCF
jgi:hypothetical protein